MSLDYYLIENKLTANEDDCTARTQDVQTVGIDELTAQITGRGMSLTDTEVQAVLNELSYAINAELQKGNAVHTPFVKISPSIGGVFTNSDDSFDPARHKVRLKASVGASIQINPTKLKTKKVVHDTIMPEISSIKDYTTQDINQKISRNATAELHGRYIKIDPNDPEQGIFITSQGQEVRVQQYMLNKPSHIIFMVPQSIPSGEVQIVLKTKYRSRTKLKTASLQHSLIVSE